VAIEYQHARFIILILYLAGLSKPLKILVAPLNWGLGHATRCIPVIRALLLKNVEVILGGSGISGQLLRNQFPHLPYEEIPGYQVTYSKKLPMAVAMLGQAPGILQAIQQEKKWLDEKLKKESIDIVISDHRYGLYHKNTYSVFMAHQLFISSGSKRILEPLLWKVNKAYIENFNHCWIPDVPGEPNAAGKLAHQSPLPFPHHFIGWLSQLAPMPKTTRIYQASFILSGLEPLRTEFENILIEQFHQLPPGKYALVRGTDAPLERHVPDFVDLFHLAHTTQIEKLVQTSEILVSRAGYSSIMDYLLAGAQALLIPTPGQTEQEYLAQYHKDSGNFYSTPQTNLQLAKALSQAHEYRPQPPLLPQPHLLENAVQALLNYNN
jgi:UDP:flavonoid glycosyltransferase YjiC (YdhE family)